MEFSLKGPHARLKSSKRKEQRKWESSEKSISLTDKKQSCGTERDFQLLLQREESPLPSMKRETNWHHPLHGNIHATRQQDNIFLVLEVKPFSRFPSWTEQSFRPFLLDCYGGLELCQAQLSYPPRLLHQDTLHRRIILSSERGSQLST